MSYSIFDLEVFGRRSTLLFEKGFKNVVWFPKVDEHPDTTRSVLSTHAANIGEYRKTENELPPPYASLAS